MAAPDPGPARLVVDALLAAVPGSTWLGGWVILPSRAAIRVVEGAPTEVRMRGAGADRGTELRVSVASEADLPALAPVLAAARWWADRVTIDGVRPGDQLLVVAPFQDHAGQAFAPGERLTVLEKHHNAYHDGTTVVCAERTFWVEGRTPLADDLDLVLERRPPA